MDLCENKLREVPKYVLYITPDVAGSAPPGAQHNYYTSPCTLSLAEKEKL